MKAWSNVLKHTGADTFDMDAQAYVTGLRAANNAMAVLKRGGRPADIYPLEPEEPHVLALRQAIRLGQQLRDVADFTPLRDVLPSVVR